MRIPREFREQHRHIPRPRVYTGRVSWGAQPPVFRYPWRCSCGAEGRHGGARGEFGSHRDHVEDAWEETQR